MISSYAVTKSTMDKYTKVEMYAHGTRYTFFYAGTRFQALMLDLGSVYYYGKLHAKHPLKGYAKTYLTKTKMLTHLSEVFEGTPWQAMVSAGTDNISISMSDMKADSPNAFFYPEKDMRVLMGEGHTPELIESVKQLILSWNPHFDVRGIRHRPLVVGTIEQKAEASSTPTHATIKPIKGSNPDCMNAGCEGTGWFIQGITTEPCQTCQTVLFTAHKKGKLCTATSDAGTPCLAYKKKGENLCYQHWKKDFDKSKTLIVEPTPASKGDGCVCKICIEHTNHNSIMGQHVGACNKCGAKNVIISPWSPHGDVCLVCVVKYADGFDGHTPVSDEVLQIIEALPEGHNLDIPMEEPLTGTQKHNLEKLKHSDCNCDVCKAYAMWAGPDDDWAVHIAECKECGTKGITYHFKAGNQRLCSQCAKDKGCWDGKA